MVVLGIVGPLIGYLIESHSFDVAERWGAAPMAFLQAVVFVGFGLAVIWSSSRPPDDSDDDSLPRDQIF